MRVRELECEVGSAIQCGNVERGSARMRCTSRCVRVGVHARISDEVSRTAMIIVVIRDTKSESCIHGERATGRRRCTIVVRRQVDYNGCRHNRDTTGADTSEIQWTRTQSGVDNDSTRGRNRVSWPNVAESLWSRRGRTIAPNGGGLVSLRTQCTCRPYITDFHLCRRRGNHLAFACSTRKTGHWAS